MRCLLQKDGNRFQRFDWLAAWAAGLEPVLCTKNDLAGTEYAAPLIDAQRT